LDDLNIIETIVDMRDSAEENIYFTLLLEGIIGFFILILAILLVYFNETVVGIIIIFACFLLYGMIMTERLVQIRLLKKIKNKLEDIKNERKD